MIQYSKNFTDADFPEDRGIPDPILLQKLQEARDEYGQVIIINCGGRTQAQNDPLVASGMGVSDSAHLIDATGHFKAVDVMCSSSASRLGLMKVFLPRFKRIGIGTHFIHVDADETKPQDVVWVYPK